MMFGPWVITIGAGLATFVGATRRPRYYWPYIGMGLIVVLVVFSVWLTGYWTSPQ